MALLREKISLLCGLMILFCGCAVTQAESEKKNAEKWARTCPKSPNCVSSFHETSPRFIAPFFLSPPFYENWRRLGEYLQTRGRTEVKEQGAGSVLVEYRTALFGFVDDGLFLLDSDSGRVDVRSASRVGYWDLGKNRRRLEDIRRELQTRGILKSSMNFRS